ncbi:hypothetical protein N658DRAFT_102443 [Parathielavia hyrcaniae]|uniref:Uncharacterized protein n=1 Tax=Parathielavia hyrcaniae TaxID=113614 RepID=A0AAN6PYZ0_9PEZI|nr:hypothetical protein N658DRAFT_102443 [Parathielavia hyrcaniae]
MSHLSSRPSSPSSSTPTSTATPPTPGRKSTATCRGRTWTAGSGRSSKAPRSSSSMCRCQNWPSYGHTYTAIRVSSSRRRMAGNQGPTRTATVPTSLGTPSSNGGEARGQRHCLAFALPHYDVAFNDFPVHNPPPTPPPSTVDRPTDHDQVARNLQSAVLPTHHAEMSQLRPPRHEDLRQESTCNLNQLHVMTTSDEMNIIRRLLSALHLISRDHPECTEVDAAGRGLRSPPRCTPDDLLLMRYKALRNPLTESGQ